jgi:hypothetical protein
MKLLLTLLCFALPFGSFADELFVSREARGAEIKDPSRAFVITMRVSAGGVSFSRRDERPGQAAPAPDAPVRQGLYLFGVEARAAESLVGLLTKFQEWTKIAVENDVLDFVKPIGNIEGMGQLQFVWRQKTKSATLHPLDKLREDDVPAIIELAKQYAEARGELGNLQTRQAREAELFK